ncbi:MAG: energy transducer TonB [bacterium]
MEDYINNSSFNNNNRNDDYNKIPFGYAILLGVVFELVLVAAAILILSHMPKYVPIPQQKPIMISLAAIPTPPKPIVKPKPKPAPPKPRPVVKPKPTPIPHPKPRVVRHTAQKVFKAVHVKNVPPSPAVHEIVQPSPKPAPVVEHGHINPSLIAMLTGEIRQKIKSSLVYPSVAKTMRMQGKVKVLFTYYNGVISKIKIIRVSQFSLLNSGAIKTLELANYPMPPKKLRNRILQFSIWIRFKLHR